MVVAISSHAAIAAYLLVQTHVLKEPSSNTCTENQIGSSGGTLMACAKALTGAGANVIDVVITHALFPPELASEFIHAGIRSIRSTHSVPHPTNAIILDDIIVAALSSEMAETDQPGRAT